MPLFTGHIPHGAEPERHYHREVPYYYEVMINDEPLENCYTGYVSKRSICLTESDDNATDVDAK